MPPRRGWEGILVLAFYKDVAPTALMASPGDESPGYARSTLSGLGRVGFPKSKVRMTGIKLSLGRTKLRSHRTKLRSARSKLRSDQTKVRMTGSKLSSLRIKPRSRRIKLGSPKTKLRTGKTKLRFTKTKLGFGHSARPFQLWGSGVPCLGTRAGRLEGTRPQS